MTSLDNQGLTVLLKVTELCFKQNKSQTFKMRMLSSLIVFRSIFENKFDVLGFK